jgi:hypothetical protein
MPESITEPLVFPWGHNRRFNAYSNYNKAKYGERIQKVAIDAGFTCPNRDGTAAFGGCSYCNNDSFNPSYCDPSKPISQQLEDGMEFLSRRYKVKKYLAYFQAYSNTYSSLDSLKDIYEQALDHPDVCGLVIGTRPDCVDEEKLAYFEELSKSYDITIEYGIESCYNKTLARINRGHRFEKTVEALKISANRGIFISGHLIFGLPGESREEMLEQVDIINTLGLDSIKLHQLHIVKKTVMAFEYRANPSEFNLFSLEEYKEFITEFIERLDPKIIIQRLFGEAPPYMMAGPTWGDLRNSDVLERIEAHLEEKNTYQGRLFKSE